MATLDSAVSPTETAVVYTPYNLTQGEARVIYLPVQLLSLPVINKAVTPNCYSRLRLSNLGIELGLDLSAIELMTETEFLNQSPPDLLLTMGNH